LGVEELDLVATELLDAEAANGALGLSEDGGGRGVAKSETTGTRRAGELILGDLKKSGIEMLPHAETLFERAAKNADLAGGLVKEIEKSGDGAEMGLAAAARSPDDEVAGRLEIGAT
jgi:hypothetical protein